MPRDLIYKLLDQKVNQYMQISYNCAQNSYLALEEQFGLKGEEVLKALTPLAGIADATTRCSEVVWKAVRIAAEIILDDTICH